MRTRVVDNVSVLLSSEPSGWVDIDISAVVSTVSLSGELLSGPAAISAVGSYAWRCIRCRRRDEQAGGTSYCSACLAVHVAELNRVLETAVGVVTEALPTRKRAIAIGKVPDAK